MMTYRSITPLVCPIVVFVGSLSLQEDQSIFAHTSSVNLQKIQEAARENPSPRYREVILRRKLARRRLQQQSYAGLLYDTVQHDGAGSLISYIKMNVLLEFSLEHGFLFWIVPPDPRFNIPGVPFQEDLNCPEDPWKNE